MTLIMKIEYYFLSAVINNENTSRTEPNIETFDCCSQRSF